MVAWVTGALAAILIATPAAADPDPGKGPPDVPEAPVAPCAVVPSGNSEFASCVGVTAKLDRAPPVGATATLTATIRASRALPGTDVTITLPAQLAWAQKPAESTVSLTAEKPVTVTGVVKAVTEGFGEISVRATAPDGATTQSGSDSVFLTVAGAGKASQFGALATSADQPAVRATPTKVFQRPAGQELRSATVAGTASPSLACDTSVIGNWGYFDQNNLWHNEMNVNVVINDAVNGRVGGALTDFNGNVNICIDSAKGTRISANFILANDSWQVQNLSGNQYRWTTEIHTVTPGVTVNIGSRTSDATLSRGLHAFDEANDAWQFIPKPTNTCWDQKDTACRQLKINWAPDSTDGTNYNRTANDIHLIANDPNVAMVVVHEIGHAVMDDVYNDAMPPGCNPHPQIDVLSSTGCAWVEGFADWFALAVYHEISFHFQSGPNFNMEVPSWSDNRPRGDAVESRVVGAMLDIQDSTNELLWDRSSDGFNNLWFTFTHHINATFASFWNSRIADGFNVSDTGALASVYQNTIDYGFRDPLPDNLLLTRPRATPHNFSMNTTTRDWSVVAVAPSVGSDVDLTVYDDRAQTTPVANSLGGIDVVDFVAIDTNRRALGDYYPQVNEFSGGTQYQLEVAQNRNILSPATTQTVHMPNDVVAVRDTFLTAGVPVSISATPSTTQQNPGLFLMGDDPSNAFSFVRSRISAVASGAVNGPGVAESLTFTPTISGWYGVVITNQHGVGDYTLTRS